LFEIVFTFIDFSPAKYIRETLAARARQQRVERLGDIFNRSVCLQGIMG
jgi:hypothetical protein